MDATQSPNLAFLACNSKNCQSLDFFAKKKIYITYNSFHLLARHCAGQNHLKIYFDGKLRI